ncbi:MAG TPA: NAD(P)-dependent oxidoreductase [Actinomycetes bacterium]|nr:NAD(P)-dependent oxidoreductase [Actinomycetes bacterium]
MAGPVGVIGLGIMGSAMAGHLVESGFDVVGYDIVAEKRQALTSAGGRAAATVAEVAEAAGPGGVVVTSLPSSEALAAVAAPDGLPAGGQPGLVVAETSTLTLQAKLSARDALAASGIVLLDCTISGTGAQARARDLVFYASGDEAAVERCLPVLRAVGRNVHRVGAFGNGSKMKFVANLLVSIHNLATAEAMLLARKAGLDPRDVLRAIADGAGTSRIFELRGPLIAERRYHEPTATVRMFLKDLDAIARFAGSLAVPTPLFSACLPFYLAAAAQGRHDQDVASLGAVLEAMAGP